MKSSCLLSIATCAVLVVGCDRSSPGQSETVPPVLSSNTRAQHENGSVVTNDNSALDVSAKPADNTGRNVRDRSDATVTPGDQSNAKADVEITRQIRQAITANPQLSTIAKNVKIIDSGNGKVTLRGPVNSPAEQQLIVQIVQGVQGVTSVDNQLEVKANP